LTSCEFSFNADPPSYPWTGADQYVAGQLELSIALEQMGSGYNDYNVTFECPQGGSVDMGVPRIRVNWNDSFPVNTSRSVTITLPAGPGPFTYIVKVNNNEADSTIGYVVKIASPLQYESSPNTFVDAPDPMYVAKGSTVTFKANPSPLGADWPSDPSVASPAKPVWGGTSGASGTGETKAVTFNTVNSYSVTAECGNTETANVTVGEKIISINNFHNPPTNVMFMVRSNTTVNNSKVAPGQQVTLQLVIIDYDFIRYEGEGFMTGIRPTPESWGTYSITVKVIQNAQIVLENNILTDEFSTPASRNSHRAIAHFNIKVSDPLPNEVILEVKVNDLVTIPNDTLPFCPENTLPDACRDPQITEYITWLPGENYPTEITPVRQYNWDEEEVDLNSEQLGDIRVHYLLGPDEPNEYEGLFIDERFGVYDSNLSLEHLSEAAVNQYLAMGITTDIDLRASIFSNTGNNTSFRVDINNEFYDEHIGSFFSEIQNDLEEGKNVELWYTLPQWYLSNNIRLNANDYIIRVTRPVGETASYTYQKEH